MLSDGMKKVSRGAPFRGIPAKTWNSLIDLLHKPQRQIGGGPSHAYKDADVIPIKNITGVALEQFEIVGLSESHYDPTDETELSAFTSSRCMDGEVPDFDDGHNIRYGIIQAPADTDEVVPCCVTGFSPVQLKVHKSWHKFAQPVDGETGYLESAPYGPAIIHWADAGEGETGYALVSVKSQSGMIILGKAKTNWNKAGGDGCYVNVYPCSDFAGTGADTDNEIKVWLPRNGRNEDPNIVANDIIQCVLLDGSASTPEAVCVSNYLDGKAGQSYKLIAHSATTPHPYLPRGWEIVSDFDGKTIAMNSSEGLPTGYDLHGTTENNHNEHDFDYTTDNADSGFGKTLVSSISYDFSHSDTSNWPPYEVIDICIRLDNSAT